MTLVPSPGALEETYLGKMVYTLKIQNLDLIPILANVISWWKENKHSSQFSIRYHERIGYMFSGYINSGFIKAIDNNIRKGSFYFILRLTCDYLENRVLKKRVSEIMNSIMLEYEYNILENH